MKKKILIVDDEAKLQKVLKFELEYAGYEIICADDGMAGLKKIKEEHPDLIILDLNMPKLDGYQVCRMVKFDKTLCHIPIIMLTALGQQEDQEWGKKVKANAYLVKPYDPDELLAQVENFLQHRKI